MIDLNIFTNCTQRFSDTAGLITKTLESFKSIFSSDHIGTLRVFVDPNPRIENLQKYVECIAKDVPNVHEIVITRGLADGYVKSTKMSKTDFIFQLEHDWVFTDSISHSLDEIASAMGSLEIEHLRFNKRNNIVTPSNEGVDTYLEEHSIGNFKCCKTPFRSNNPHIINRKAYLDKWNSRIWHSYGGPLGVEDALKDSIGFIYGGLNHPQQIIHLDGKN